MFVAEHECSGRGQAEFLVRVLGGGTPASGTHRDLRWAIFRPVKGIGAEGDAGRAPER